MFWCFRFVEGGKEKGPGQLVPGRPRGRPPKLGYVFVPCALADRAHAQRTTHRQALRETRGDRGNARCSDLPGTVHVRCAVTPPPQPVRRGKPGHHYSGRGYADRPEPVCPCRPCPCGWPLSEAARESPER